MVGIKEFVCGVERHLTDSSYLQLLEATTYAEKLGVALKGDIPIGVTRCSADVWAEPHIFKLSHNAGAPGNPEQNWGFPVLIFPMPAGLRRGVFWRRSACFGAGRRSLGPVLTCQ